MSMMNLINGNYVMCSKPSVILYSKTYDIIRTEIVRNESTTETNIQNKWLNLAFDADNGRISYSDLQKIINILSKSTSALSESNGLFLLQCCGNLLPDVKLKKRHELVNVVWNLIQKKSRNLTLQHYHTLLTVHLENSQYVDPDKFLKHMTVDPNENTYQLLLSVVANHGDEVLVNNILSEMDKKNYALSEKELAALVQVYSLKGNIKNAFNVIEFIKSKDMELPTKIYGYLAYGYAMNNNIENLLDTLKENSQDVGELMRIIKFLSSSENKLYIPKILEFLTKPKINESEGIIRHTIVELVCENDIETAYAILSYISTVNKTVTINIIDTFIKSMIESQVTRKTIINFIKRLSQLEHPEEILTKVAKTLLCLFEKSLALSTFEIMKSKSIRVKPHYYWPLFQNASKYESNILSLLKDMKSLDVEIDFDTLFYYVYPYITIKNPYATFKMLHFKKLNTSVILASLLAFLVKNDKLTLAKQLYNQQSSNTVHLYIIPSLINIYRRTKNEDMCVSLLSDLCHTRASIVTHFILDLLSDKCNEITAEDICKLLQAYKKYKIKIGLLDLTTIKSSINFSVLPNTVHEKIMKLLNELSDTKYVQTIIDTYPMHRSAMTVNQLECHLIELKTKGKNARSVLWNLFQKYCVDNNLEKLQELKKELDSSNFVWTPGMKSHLFDLYARRNLLDDAMLVFEDIQKQFPDFKIDKFKIINLAHKFVERNELDRAISLIQNYKNISCATNTNINCAEMLQAVAKLKNAENVEKMLNILLDNEYCTVNERVLSCLVVVHLLQNDTESAIKAFKKCAELHRVLPAKHELLTSLIKLKATERTENVWKQFNEVYNIIVQIQGERCANLNSIIALAKCNEIKELQRKLQTHRISPDFLIKYTSFLPCEETIDILLKILKINAFLNNFNPQLVYKHIREQCDLLEADEAASIMEKLEMIQKSQKLITKFSHN